MALLGLAKDQQPLTHTYSEESASRQWKTSLMGSFASNVALVLYNCSSQLKVQVFVKEDVVRLEQCRSDLCTVDEFISAFGPIADHCAIDDGCNDNAGSVPSLSLTLVFVVIGLIHLY